MICDLFYDSFLEVFGGVEVLAGDFLHIVTNHQFNELLKAGGLRVPSQFTLGLTRVTQQVDYVGRTVEVGANLYDYVTLLDTLYFVT